MSGRPTTRASSCAGRSASTRYDRHAGEITIHFRITGVGTDWIARTQPGDKSVEMLGPLGRPFERDPRTRHVLLVAGGLGMAGVRSMADEALAAGCNVTLLFGAASAAQVYPSSLLPDEVEYIVATDDGSFGHKGFVTELIPQFEAWADQCLRVRATANVVGARAPGGRPTGAPRRCPPRRAAWQGQQVRATRKPDGATARVATSQHGTEHGLCRRSVPGLRRDGRRRPAARLSRGPRFCQ